MIYDISCSCSFTLLLGLVILVIFFCITSKSSGYYNLKFTIFTLVSALSTALTLPFMCLRPKDWRNALILSWIIRMTMKLMGVEFIIRGKENIVKNSGALVVINHQSALDLVVLANLWTVMDNGAVVARTELLKYTGPFGLAAYMWGTIFIDRNKKTDAKNALNGTIDIIKKKNTKIMIFPEGTRHSENKLKPFKKGAFHVAISGQVPIQPVVVSKYYFINHETKSFGPGSCFIQILPEISTEGLTEHDVDNLVLKTNDLMNLEFQKISNEIIQQHHSK